MRMVWTESAVADIDRIHTYIAERNPRAAVTVTDTIEATAARLGRFPYSAAMTDEPGTRMAPAGRYPYVIFYTVTDDEVQILRVMHGAQQRPWERQADEAENGN